MFQKQFIFLFTLTLFLSCGEAKTNTTVQQNETAVDVSETITSIESTVEPIAVSEKRKELTAKRKTKNQVTVKKEKINLVVENTPPPTIKSAQVAVKEVKEKTKQPDTKVVEKVKEVVPVKVSFSHTSWNDLLQKYVTASGKVNYNGFVADKVKLQAYLDLLAANPIQKSWSRNKKMAYWINAYNAFTIKLIVDNYPVSSIMKTNNGKPWDKKWIKLGGKTYSLNQIENDILRPKYKDARIHFAVNCAAKSCPTLLNRAWTADNLNRNLEQQAKKFINNASFNTITAKSIKISKIFEWYAVDFGDNIVTYLNKYSTVKIDAKAKVAYVDYDWALNKK